MTAADRRRLWRKRWMPWQRLLLGGLAVAALAYGGAALDTEYAISQHTAVAEADVVEVQHARGPDTITVEFTTAAGQVHRSDIEDDGPSAGDTVKVEYDAHDPQHARLSGSRGQLVAGFLYAGLGLVLAFFALFRPQVGLRRGRR